jgi:hypothetical protein
MHPRTESEGQDVISRIIAGTAAALSRCPGDNGQQQQARADAAAAVIRQFEPRDAIEAMLAGHSVMFHCLLDEAVERLRANAASDARGGELPAGLVALNNAFHRNLDRFERSRKRRAEGVAVASREIAGRAGERLADATAEVRTRTTAAPVAPPIPAVAVMPPETGSPLPGLPAKLAPPQQLQASVDALGSGVPSARPPDAIRSGTSMNAARVVAAGGISATRPNSGVVTGRR